MGRRGYVQKRHAEHDQSVGLSDYAQATAVAYLEEKGIDVCTGDSSGMADPDCSDHLEIAIPTKKVGRGKNEKYVLNTDKMNRIIADLRKHPGKVKSEYGDGAYGEELADLLEAGMKAAEKHDYNWILVDFW